MAHHQQDENGQWWYVWGSNPERRSRVSSAICFGCKKEYLATRKKTKFCSRECGCRNAGKSGAGPDGSRWKGGRRINNAGYVEIWISVEERARRKRGRHYILEHRLVMEEALGRELEPEERVHHKNGVKTDNRPENLELWKMHSMPGQRVSDLEPCPHCEGTGVLKIVAS